MRCVVDTNVLVDVLEADPVHARPSAKRVSRAVQSRALVVPPFVLCELLAGGRDAGRLAVFFQRARLGLEEHVPLAVYQVAAERYRRYLLARKQQMGVVDCPRCGAPQLPVCSECGHGLAVRKPPMDFLIGAYAVVAGDRCMLTRDQGTYRTYFPELVLV